MAKTTNLEEKDINTEAKVQEEKEAEKKAPFWVVKVKNNPNFCGVGAGGIQFANGEAVVTSGRMAEWFMEHDGYEVVVQ